MQNCVHRQLRNRNDSDVFMTIVMEMVGIQYDWEINEEPLFPYSKKTISFVLDYVSSFCFSGFYAESVRCYVKYLTIASASIYYIHTYILFVKIRLWYKCTYVLECIYYIYMYKRNRFKVAYFLGSHGNTSLSLHLCVCGYGCIIVSLFLLEKGGMLW